MNKSLYKAVSLVTVLAMLLMALPLQPAQAAGSISLSALGSSYTQDFDTLANTGTSSVVPTGWEFAESGTNANLVYTAGTGSGNSGDTYSFGTGPISPLPASTERAFGGLRSGSLVPLVGAQFSNATGSVITNLAIAYTGEQWRLGQNTAGRAADRLDFQYSLDATSLTTGTWVDVNGLDFSSPAISGTLGALNGNAPANRTALSFTVSGLNIANGANFWVRWADTDLVPGSDDGLAVDDFSLVPSYVEPDGAPAVASTSPASGATDVVLTSNLEVSFSEAVTLSGDWFQLACPVSGTRGSADAVVSSGPAVFAIDLTADLANSETCTLTVFATQVADQDANDPPDTMVADYSTSFTTFGPDAAPAVASTVPAPNAVNVPLNQSITVNFTEAVTLSEPWYSLTCAISGAHPAVVTGGPTSYLLDPATDFVYGESCSFVIDPAMVSDLDNNDPPDFMVLNFTAGFNTLPDPCTLPYTPIYQIQGSGATAAITGSVTTQGVVVGDYESTTGVVSLRGYFLQDLNGDGNPATSDGIFVFNSTTNNLVNLGDVVRITGSAGENQGQTQISSSTVLKCGVGSVNPVDVTLPVPSSTYLEQYEGMLVRLPQTLYVTEMFQLGRFGQVVLSADGKLKQPTNMVAPGAPAQALQAQNNLNKIILDDALQAQNPDPILFGRNGSPLSASNTLRGGDTATNIVGVLNFTWAGNAASPNAYRVRPINALNGFVNFEASNPRPSAAPAVGGNVKVVGMNLLNFFNTFADANTATPGCFPSGGDGDCRGANTAGEFERQYTKTVAAITAMNPDVLGVNEIENDGYAADSSLQFLVDQLNAVVGAGTYALIDVDTATGQVNAMGTDAIRIAMIYKPAVVTPVGQTAVLNTDAFVKGGDASPRNRASLAQAFQVNANGGVFIVNVNHLKSKGSACTAPDAGDGQGNCNQVRVNAVTELLNWFATDPTGTGDPDILMVGDYNSYAKEDPITTLVNGGFNNLIETFLGPDAYSYVFDGQWGYLDQALGSASLKNQVTGVGDYHINADEPSVLDYLLDFKSAAQLISLYAPDQYRVSDHDPVVVGLKVNAPPSSVDAGGPYTVGEGGTVAVSATGTDPDNDPLSYAWDLDNNGTFETAGQSVTASAAGLDGPTSFTIRVRASDPLGLSVENSVTVTVTNVAPTVSAAYTSNSLACGINNATLNISFSDLSAADTFTAVIRWGDGSTQTVAPAVSPLSLGHTYTSAGIYRATITLTDDDGGTDSTTARTTVNFNTSGFLPPLNVQDNLFKYKSTIPVKIRFTNCNGSAPAYLFPIIKVTKLSGSTSDFSQSPFGFINGIADLGLMRFSDGQYIYNLNTRDLPDSSASYLITVILPINGQTTTVKFSLRP